MTDKTTDIKMALENMIRFRDTIERLGGSMAKEFDVETKGKRTYSMNNDMSDLYNVISRAVEASGADHSINEKLTNVLKRELVDYVSIAHLKTKLSVLYEFEKNYLQLIAEYKEEIKFASSLQEDLRKERAKFFSETLKEVYQTLNESQVDNEVASKWIKELVGSYTKSLDLSGGLVEEHTLDTIACIRAEAKLNKPSIEPGNN